LEAIDAMERIRQVIDRVNDSQSMIAAAVEEQSATANEIVRSVHEAANGSNAISENIDGVAQAATTNSAAAERTLGTADEVAGNATQLLALVGRFRV